jgi:hypothetical protein
VPELNTTVENTENSQTLCELELWRPPQGTISEAIPLSIDLDFDAETVQLPTTSFSVRTRRATVHLGMTDADLVRGSRLGEYVLDPQMTADVTQSVRQAIETETGAEGLIEVEVKPNIFGRMAASVFWKKRRSKKAEHDHIVKSSMRVSRVIPRTGGKWAVVEPVAPHVLSGRYVGSDGEKEVGPLCLLTMRGEACLVQVIVTVNRQDLNIEQNNAGAQHSRNKVAVLDEMARRAIASNQVTNFALPPYIGPEDIVLSKSSMEVTVEDE